MMKVVAMKFSRSDKLCLSKGLKAMEYDQLIGLAKAPTKVALTQQQYRAMAASERSYVKKDQPYFITSSAKTRTNNAVKSAGLTGMVVDIDSTTKDIKEVANVLLVAGVGTFLIYTSLSHTAEQPRYRVVIPFSDSAKATRWEIVARYLNEVLFVEGDDCSKTMAQAWLLPVCLVDGDYDSFVSNEGQVLDINDESHPFVVEVMGYNLMMKESKDAKPVSSHQYSTSAGELNPIDVYNQSCDLRELMSRYGYVFKSKNTAVHPHSQSGSAGIYIFPSGERAFSHHGCDQYCGKSFDAFDLYVAFEHQGNFSDAFKSAANTLRTTDGVTITEHNRKLHQNAKAYKAMPQMDVELIDGQFVEYEKTSMVISCEDADIVTPPMHCFEFKGIGKDIFEHIIKTSIYVQPTFALASTLSILTMLSGGSLTGTKTRVRSNIMFICIGESGCGKQHHINKIEEITRLVDPTLNASVQNRFVSGPAFWQFLAHRSPVLLYLVDECGFVFSAIKSNKGDYQAQLYDCVLQGYSASSTVLKPTVYANAERNSTETIEFAHINFMGFTTTKTLGDALSHEDSDTGLLPRMLFVPAQYDVPEKQEFKREKFD